MTINEAEDIPYTLSFRDAELPWKERMDSVTSVVFGEHVSECGFPFEKHPNLTSATFLNPVCGEYIENFHGKIVGYVLIASAKLGAGEDSGLTEAQLRAADVNNDVTPNASDAAVILIYSAAVGAGNTDAKLSDFVH